MLEIKGEKTLVYTPQQAQEIQNDSKISNLNSKIPTQ